MNVEFDQILKDDDYINFGIQHYFKGNKKMLLTTLIFPLAGLFFIVWYFLSNPDENFMLIVGVIWLVLPLLRYFGVRRQLSATLKTSRTKNLPTHYQFNEDEFSAINQLTSNTVKYAAVFDIKESKRYIFIYLVSNYAFIIDKEQLETEKVKILKQIIAIKHPTAGLLKELN